MKRFLAIYTGSPNSLETSGWNRLSDDERRQREAKGIEAWVDWAQRNAANIVDDGGPLGRTKRVSSDGIADIRNAMTGYVVVQAESHEAAAKLFETHPHFTLFPGDGVELMECLPTPGR